MEYLPNIEKVWGEPEDQFKTVISLINCASYSIDIHIYQLTSERVWDALIRAKSRGVAIRIMVNGQVGGYGFTSFLPSVKIFLTFRQELINAPGDKGLIRTRWSSNNMGFSHIKSLLIDKDRQHLAKLIILTGNLVDDVLGHPLKPRDFGFLCTNPRAIKEASDVF